MIYIHFASCQASLKSVHWFWRIRLLKGLNIYGHDGHVGHVTWIIYILIGFLFIQMYPIKFGFDWPSSFRVEDL